MTLKSRKMRWAGKVARVVEKKKNAWRFLVGKSEGKRPLARLRRWCQNNIKMDVRKLG
jgi:hypothetical protein